MKRIGNLYEFVYDKDTIRKAIKEASKGKRKRRDVKKILRDEETYVRKLHKLLKKEKFSPAPYIFDTILDGSQNKQREILKPKFYPDQIVHWCIYLTIRDHIYPKMYSISCGSIPGRGVHYGKRFVEKWIREDRKNTKYYMQLDVTKFYQSIKPDKLMEKIRRKFKDEKLLSLLESILYMSDGLPIGMLLSQVFANFFASDIDFYIKQDLKAVHYIRYMDDMVIFGRNKKELHNMRKQIASRLRRDGLTLKSNWKICKFDKEPLDFMGFRFYRDHTALRKSIMLRISRKARKVGRKGKAATSTDACSIISYMGWISHSDSYGFFMRWVKPYVSIRRMKNIIRRTQCEKVHKRKHSQTSGVG